MLAKLLAHSLDYVAKIVLMRHQRLASLVEEIAHFRQSIAAFSQFVSLRDCERLQVGESVAGVEAVVCELLDEGARDFGLFSLVDVGVKVMWCSADAAANVVRLCP